MSFPSCLAVNFGNHTDNLTRNSLFFLFDFDFSILTYSHNELPFQTFIRRYGFSPVLCFAHAQQRLRRFI